MQIWWLIIECHVNSIKGQRGLPTFSSLFVVARSRHEQDVARTSCVHQQLTHFSILYHRHCHHGVVVRILSCVYIFIEESNQLYVLKLLSCNLRPHWLCVCKLHATRETSTCYGTARHHMYDLYGVLGTGFRCPQFSLSGFPHLLGVVGWQTFWDGRTWWAFRCRSLDGCSPLYHGRGHCGTYSIFFMASFL